MHIQNFRNNKQKAQKQKSLLKIGFPRLPHINIVVKNIFLTLKQNYILITK